MTLIAKTTTPFRHIATAAALSLLTQDLAAHHSFAMYDSKTVYVMTGVVTRVDPNPNHLQVFIAPLNEQRDQVIKDATGEPVVWAIEMDGAAIEARDGITVNGFPRGTIVSVGLHPLRNGFPGGGRGESGFYKCPADTPPAPGQHCDAVSGATTHGKGVLPTATAPLPIAKTKN
jgi:Family of unknown function (DUF6152)